MISVILPVYNREEILCKFIDSVISQTYQDFEIIIVDDGSKDKSYEVATEYSKKDPRIKCFKHSKNQGPLAARNTALKASKGGLIFSGEDDVILDPKCFEILVNTFAELKSQYKVGAVAPRLISSKEYNDKQDLIAKVDRLTGDLKQNWSSDAKLTEVPFLHACSLISRKVFIEIGGWNNSLYKGNFLRDESDVYFRARKVGFKLFFQPKALAWHLHFSKGGCKIPLIKSNYYTIRNHSLFLIKFFGLKAVYMIPSYSISLGFTIFKVQKLQREVNSQIEPNC